MNLNTLINANKRKFDIKFKKLLKNKLDKSSLSNAIFYGSMNGGKRIRPFLVMESAKIAKISSNDAFIIASCIECIHSYSLIHDDLPSMDDDDYRRGVPVANCLIKVLGTFEHSSHIGDRRNIPVSNGLIERRSPVKHMTHIGNITHIPT